MKYRVHKLEVKKDTAQEKLQSFLNQLQGEILSKVPCVVPAFQAMLDTAKAEVMRLQMRRTTGLGQRLSPWPGYPIQINIAA